MDTWAPPVELLSYHRRCVLVLETIFNAEKEKELRGGRLVPFFARSSARVLPMTPRCPGDHLRVILRRGKRERREKQVSRNSREGSWDGCAEGFVIWRRAETESEKNVTFWMRVCPSIRRFTFVDA